MEQTVPKHKVHRVLAHSYGVYFFSFLFGIIFDFIFPISFPYSASTVPLGMILIVIATLVIVQSQKTSKKHERNEKVSHLDFYHGLYKVTRSPTHAGLALLIIGFGFLTNAFFVIVFGLISMIITRFTFLRKEEKYLEKKYGEIYANYKKMVKF